jgi:hypothetical protein
MDIVGLLLTLLVLGVCLWLCLWLIDSSPVPEPFKMVLHWIVLAVAVIWLISLLLGLIGYGGGGTTFPMIHSGNLFHKGG